MLPSEKWGGNRWRRRWYELAVVFAIAGLTVSLATRTFQHSFPQNHTVKSRSPQPMRQHLDRDAVRWFPPAPIFTNLQIPYSYMNVTPAEPPAIAVLFDESLSNRPPPFSSSLLFQLSYFPG